MAGSSSAPGEGRVGGREPAVCRGLGTLCIGAWRDVPKSLGCHAQGCSRALSPAVLWAQHCLACSGTVGMGGSGTEGSQLPPDPRGPVPGGQVSLYGQPEVKVFPAPAQVWATGSIPIRDSVSLLCVEVMMEKPSDRGDQRPRSPWAEVGYPAQTRQHPRVAAGAGGTAGLGAG